MLNISSEGLATVDATKLVPYPEPDMWFIAFQAKCIYNKYVFNVIRVVWLLITLLCRAFIEKLLVVKSRKS